MLQGFPIDRRRAATSPMHATDAMPPHGLAICTAARFSSIWRGISTPGGILNQFFMIGNIGTFDAFICQVFSAEDGMSSSHEKFPDRTADFSKAGEEGGKAIENVTHSAASLLSSAKESAGDFAGNAAETFKSAVEEQKTAGAGAIGDVARAAKGAADNFQDRAPELANAVRTVAGKVEGISNDIRDRSVNELMAAVTEFAGQKPMAFFGCGILAGLVISRLLSSSNR